MTCRYLYHIDRVLGDVGQSLYVAVETPYIEAMMAVLNDNGWNVQLHLAGIEDTGKAQCSPATPDFWLPAEWRAFVAEVQGDAPLVQFSRSQVNVGGEVMDIIPARPGALVPDELEIQKMLVVSTAHLDQHQRDFLDDQVKYRLGNSDIKRHQQAMIVDPIGWYGWRVCLDGDLIEEWLQLPAGALPEYLGNLGTLIRLARNNGCQWLAVDRDGPVLPFVSTYEEI